MRARICSAAILCLAARILAAQGTITTVAGTGTAGFSGDGGPAVNAKITGASDTVAVDNSGNLLIVDNNRIRKVDASGNINTIAGGGTSSADGVQATAAQIFPSAAAVDSAGNIFFAQGTIVRKIGTSGVVTTVAGNPTNFTFGGDGGPALNAGFMATNVGVDAAGNLYIADSINHRIRKVDTAGIIHTIAGTGTQGFSGDNGPATSATLGLPQGLAVDGPGNVYFADGLNNRVRKVDTSGNISTIISTGVIVPLWVALDKTGNVYVADAGGNAIRKLDNSGKLTTVAGGNGLGFGGDGGPATSAKLFMPSSVAVDGAGNIYIADTDNFRIRKVAGSGGGGGGGGTPAIGSVVNGASFGNGLVSNSWATITGTNLATVTDTWANAIVNGKLPTTLDGVSVTVGFAPAYIYYVSPTQINFVVPPNLSGSVPVTVTVSGQASASFTATASTYSPAFFPWPGNQVVATRQDFTFAAKNGTFGVPTTPAAPGDVLILWGTGFGPTVPAVTPGVQVPALPNGQTYSTILPVTVTINNVSATVYGAAVATGYAGLYQIAIQVPPSIGNGDWPVTASIGGVQSPAGMVLSVHN